MILLNHFSFFYILFLIDNFFFFSSRRRHTRYWRDWSSDMCSSDLTETVLVVEDEAPVRSVARQVLERHGYTVLEAASAESALDIVSRYSGTIHLLLTDVVMPGLNGPELASRLANLRPDTRVIFMSGYTDDAVTRHGVLEPGSAYVQKPFTPDAIARKVREVLDR